jgi:hypothetical protein
LGNQEAFYEEVELLRMGMFGHGKLIEMGIPGAWREDQRLRTSLGADRIAVIYPKHVEKCCWR